ncbi:dockerin type I domain-containing protein [Ruminococcus albus]|uniref:Dockerin domain-containing protein n=1 Tax=Ruminococcus albus TaxID=1264 RepID=A0A1H7NM16_RUMAL|nr:dockerin type I domain-containing protein [Ruminococcus albus]SEL24542.1 Protein of unknown function [Ruminococcus albus]
MRKTKRIFSLSICAAMAAASIPLSVFADEVKAEEYVYGTMKIPYDKFYAAEAENLSNAEGLDAVTSATVNKTRMNGEGQLFDGTYNNAGEEGSDELGKIYGVVYPVAIKQEDLDALGENNYGFTATEKPEAYKTVTVTDGDVSFSEVNDENPETVSGSMTLNTNTPWGDYAANVTGKPENGTIIYGILIKTKDGGAYALRHEQNIWRNAEFSWTSGIKTAEPHGNTLDYKGFESLMGNTITELDYITAAGYVNVDVGEVYVPVKFSGGIVVENTAVSAGKADITLTDVPEDFDIEYNIEGLEAVFKDNSFTFEIANPGSYTLTAKDSKGKYADLSASFMLTTTDIPAEFDGKENKLIAAEGFTAEQLEAYIKNITTVVVNEKEYSASGRRATVIIKADGTLDTESSVFSEGDSFNITVKAKGYESDLVFTYTKKSEEPAEYALGDVSGDGNINITDVTKVAAHVKGKKMLDEKGRKAADVNKDGKVNITDIIRIAAHVKGKKLLK